MALVNKQSIQTLLKLVVGKLCSIQALLKLGVGGKLKYYILLDPQTLETEFMYKLL